MKSKNPVYKDTWALLRGMVNHTAKLHEHQRIALETMVAEKMAREATSRNDLIIIATWINTCHE
ncbi:MAG TPA: hypothetical protein VMR73_02155 [Candidatus Paceibacterota bacterium]|nr:hypothetical protein [Candidatus Paceibacterota bacterium]